MTSFNRVVLLALLYLAVLTSAVPVLDNSSGNEVSEHGALEARVGKASRPAPVKPRPGPAPPVVKKPVVTKKPVVVKKPVVKKPVATRPVVTKPVATRKPLPVHTKPGTHTTSTKPGTHTTVAPGAHPTTVPVHGGNTTAPHGASCPVMGKPGTTSTPGKPTKPPVTKPRELLEYAISSFFVRKRAPTPEFIGWHGTNSATAANWHAAGYLRKPWSWMDIIGQRQRAGTSGADQELGAGVYVTDSLVTAKGFAVINAGQPHNAGTTPALCAIFAHDTSVWRGNTAKAWLPNNIIGDARDQRTHDQYENYRNQWLQRVYPTVHPLDVVRVAPLDKNRGYPPGQLLIPASRTREFFARCVDANSNAVPAGAPHGDVNFEHARQMWHILDQTCV